jgi:hypothetical protein
MRAPDTAMPEAVERTLGAGPGPRVPAFTLLLGQEVSVYPVPAIMLLADVLWMSQRISSVFACVSKAEAE